MLEFLFDNMGTLIVLLLVATAVTAALLKLYKDKRAGKSSCGCSCSGCPNGAFCHGKKSDSK